MNLFCVNVNQCYKLNEFHCENICFFTFFYKTCFLYRFYMFFSYLYKTERNLLL